MPNDIELLTANGVDRRGRYLLPPVPPRVLAQIARGESPDDDTLATLQQKYDAKDAVHYGVLGDETNLAEVGWGLIFAEADSARVGAMEEALAPLTTLRRQQAGDRYYGCRKSMRFRATDTKHSYLARHDLGPGPVDPQKLPYYLLIVGSPQAIPFRFQCLLDVQFAVGRLHFDGSDDEVLQRLERYATGVVAAEQRLEQAAARSALHAAFFGARNNLDIATSLSSAELVAPLPTELAKDCPQWVFSTHINEKATKCDLRSLMGGAGRPDLLFTASHGLGLPHVDGDPFPDDLLTHQGALVCSDWGGLNHPVEREHVFAADDLDAGASLEGMVAFHFACFGAGTPRLDDFSAGASQPAIAPHDFVAALPQRMLSHAGGPALAVVGHIDRAWSYSFDWGAAGAQRAVFRKSLGQLMSGVPVGAAMEGFNARYGEISTLLNEELEKIRYGGAPDERLLAHYWTANSDARNYVVLGDPAVRLTRRA